MELTPKIENAGNILKLESKELALGMFVSELDRAWKDTPFPVGGFHLRNSDDIQLLGKMCKFVYIDINRGAVPRKAKSKENLTILSSARRAAPNSPSLKIDRDTHKVTKSIKQQIDKAFKLYSGLQKDFNQITKQVRVGKRVKFSDMEKSIAGLTEVIIANPQTAIWLMNTDPSEQYPTSYCVRAAIWACILGRQIGMSEQEMQVLFMGTMLADIGMQLLPERLVNKSGPFRKKEFLAYRKHVDMGMELLDQHRYLDDRVASIVQCHHERHDGLGFPRGIKGDRIPKLARFANLAHCFERLLCTNHPKRRVSPARAMSRLYKQRVLKFPEQLVVEFIAVLGMYPAGSIVELTNGEQAIVMEQNPTQKLRPKIAILTENNVLVEEPEVIDLSDKKIDTIDYAIKGMVKLAYSVIDPKDYTFSFFGKRIGFGGIGMRISIPKRKNKA